MAFTLQQASDATGKARSTIQRAIKSGRLSATRLSSGSYAIDPAELERVYELRATGSASDSTQQNAPVKQSNDVALLQLKIELLEIQLQKTDATVNDLRDRLDKSDAERRQLLNMLTHQTTEQAQQSNATTWFGSLFKK